MEQLLVRNIDASLKRNIKRAAEKNGRSMQAEVLETLERTYGNPDDLLSILDRMRTDLDGTELELPRRSSARSVPKLD